MVKTVLCIIVAALFVAAGAFLIGFVVGSAPSVVSEVEIERGFYGVIIDSLPKPGEAREVML